MGFIAVIVAALAGWGFGAAWYMTLSKPWTEASGIACDDNGRPIGESAAPYIMSLIAMILVAGMMRHTFVLSGSETFGKSLISGLGIGLFFISPWIMINNAYGMKPFKLTLIDAGYATFGCAIFGAVLGLF
jgi:magnesium-transporting ATPase (P-type)